RQGGRLVHVADGRWHVRDRRPALRVRHGLHLDAGRRRLAARGRVHAGRCLYVEARRARPRRHLLPRDVPEATRARRRALHHAVPATGVPVHSFFELGVRRRVVADPRRLARGGRSAVSVRAAPEEHDSGDVRAARDRGRGRADAARARPARQSRAPSGPRRADGDLTVEWVALVMFAAVVAVLMAGYPVAFSLGGVALIFAWIGVAVGGFDSVFLATMPNRIFGIMSNETLLAVPLFVFMGVTLERARLAESLLDNLGALFGRMRGGLGISVTLVGMLLAASTGIVGATVVTMGLLSLPTMLRRGYDPRIATGTICAAGTLGQIIPPSIVLVLLGDVMSSAYSQAQLAQGVFAPDTV